MSVTLRFQSTGTVPGNGEPVTMRAQSLTIGRGPDNDLVLPDPDRLISKTHCVIEDHGGNVVVMDLSTNGTFLNYGKVPLGPTPTPLNDGDVLSMGTYELVVALPRTGSGAEEPVDPLARAPVSHGNPDAAPGTDSLLDDIDTGTDFLNDLLESSDQPRGPARWVEAKDRLDDFLPPLSDDDLLGTKREQDMPAMPDHGAAVSDAFAPGAASVPKIPDDWDDLLAPPGEKAAPAPSRRPPEPPPQLPADDLDDLDDLLGPTGTAPDKPPVAVPRPAAQRPTPDPPVPADEPLRAPHRPSVTPPPQPKAARTPAAPAGGDDDAARAFLAALGAEDLDLPEAELAETMARLGAVMRVIVTGLREVLMTRTSIKSEFRIEQTRISAGDNNPLKFSVSPDQAIEAMVRPRAKGYLAAQAAAEQALDDIKAHEVAMVTGMEAALRGILKRLDPATLSGRIETGGGIGRLLKGRKALYWETYEKMYAEISDQATSDFHDIFSREFAEAYRRQLEKLNRER
jgi:type VI secretion system protein